MAESQPANETTQQEKMESPSTPQVDTETSAGDVKQVALQEKSPFAGALAPPGTNGPDQQFQVGRKQMGRDFPRNTAYKCFVYSLKKLRKNVDFFLSVCHHDKATQCRKS